MPTCPSCMDKTLLTLHDVCEPNQARKRNKMGAETGSTCQCYCRSMPVNTCLLCFFSTHCCCWLARGRGRPRASPLIAAVMSGGCLAPRKTVGKNTGRIPGGETRPTLVRLLVGPNIIFYFLFLIEKQSTVD